MPISRLIQALKGNDWNAVKSAIDEVEQGGLWRDAIAAINKEGRPHASVSSAFHTYWIERGFRVRAHVSNDSEMIAALRKLLPPYQGPGLLLYRGENLDRWLASSVGFGWTPKIEPATVFARGLAATEGIGGVLLTAEASPEAVISGPNKHSEYLGEFEHIVDPRMLLNMREIERFPRVY